MRIGFYYIAPFPTVNADIVHVVQMCRATAALGHSVSLFVPRDPLYATDAKAVEAAREFFGGTLGFEVEFLSRFTLMGHLKSLGSVISARRALARANLDLIYTRGPWACTFLPGLGKPFVFEAHELEFNYDSALLSRLMKQVVVRGSRSPNCRAVVTISHALRQAWIREGVPENKTVVAHDAVDMELFDLSLSKEEARHRLGIAPVKPMLVYTGALYERYGIQMVLDAAKELEGLEFHMIGGKPADLKRTRQEAAERKLTNVFFTGQRPHSEIPVWQAAADMLLMQWSWRFPTMAICSPMKMFEYMAAGRLIVGPGFPTIKEVLTDGEDAILFEPDNLPAMVAALKRALESYPSSDMPRKAREEVARDYTWGERCRRIFAFVENHSKHGN